LGALKLGVAKFSVIFVRQRSASFVCVDAIKNRGDICARLAHHLLNQCDNSRSAIAPAEFLGKWILARTCEAGQAGPLDQFLLLTLGANRSAKSEFFGTKIFAATNEAIPLLWVVMTGLVCRRGGNGFWSFPCLP